MKTVRRKWLIPLITLAAVLLLLLVLLLIFRQQITAFFFHPTESSVEIGATNASEEAHEIIAQDLTVPWAMAFLPSGDMLVTERPGTLRRVGEQPATYTVPGVSETSEGGLLGLALDPNYEQNQFVYVYKTTSTDNRVERYRLDGGLVELQVVIDGIPKSGNHDGGRIAFGPDGMLYVTTGDAGVSEAAQDTSSLAGKILRVTADGGIPPDNPFGNKVYSYGHRNPQGLAWDDEGRLWSTDHGRSGLSTGFDEINLIEPGGNYGWPVIQGDEAHEGMITPKLHSDPATTWAPASLAFAHGSLYFGGLRGQSLYQVEVAGVELHNLRAHFATEYGRIRAVMVHNDELYFSTSNRDGRGSVQPHDDKVLRVPLLNF